MASLDELLKEYDEIRSTARFAERIPKAERQELMGNMAETMELGQWPGDERVIKDVEKAKTRAGLAHIKSSRAETLGQVERARNMQTSLADADRQADPPVTDRMKGMVSDILSSVFPDQSPKGSVMDVPSVPNVPKMPAPVASTRPAITPDAIVSAPMPPTAPSVAKKPAVIPEGTFIPQDFPKPNAHNRTELNPDDEEYFQEWYADWAKQLDLNPDPDHPDHHYDYRGAWHAAIDPQPEVNPDTGEEEWHWDSRFKDADHPRAILDTPQGRLDTRTGKILPPLPKAEPSGDADFEAKNRSFQAFMANQALGGRTPESLGGKNPLDRYPQDDPSKHGFIGQFIEGAKGGAQQFGEAAAGTMQRLQSPDDTTTILGKKVNVGEMLGKIAGGFSEAAKEHAPHPYMQTLPWYRRLSNPEYLGNVLGNAAVATIPSLSSAIVGGVAGGVPGAAAGMMLTTYLQQAGSSYREALEAYQKQGLSPQEAHAKAYAVSGVAGLTSGAVNTLSIPASLIEPFKRTLSNLILQYGLNVSIDTADQITQNAIKQQTYKPDQELLESVPETIAASGIFGAPETMVAAKTIATGPAKVTTPSTGKPPDEPIAITPELLGGPPPSTPSVAPSTTPTTPVTTEPILSEDEEINLPEIVVRPTDSPEETKSALESAIAQAQEIHDSSAEPVTPQAETPADITPVEPSPSAQPKAIGDMTFDEFLDSAVFYRAGNMGRLKFPDGSGVMLRQNSTASNWKEQDRDFLKGLYDSRALSSTKRQQASTPETIDAPSESVNVTPIDVQPTAIETPTAVEPSAPAPIQSDADTRTLVIQSLQTGKREELQVPSVPRLTPDVLTPSEPFATPSLPAPVEPAEPKALTLHNITFDEYRDATRFSKKGKSNILTLPDGRRVRIDKDATASNWKEKEETLALLRSAYKSRIQVGEYWEYAKKRNAEIASSKKRDREIASSQDIVPAPPSDPVVNAVNPETPAPSPALTPDEITTAPAPVEIEPEAPPNVQGSRRVSDWVVFNLMKGEPITKDALAEIANDGFAGTKAQGAYTPKDAFDAVELGVNRVILDRATKGWSPTAESIDVAKKVVIAIRRDLMDQLPTMGHYRTEEQDEFQQFSTPPDLSYVMNWAANLSPDDTVLEPSAGLGGLAAYAKGAGAEVITNEFSPRRAELLKELELGRGFTENAEQLHNILPPDVKPTVVVMNPPFSSTAGRITGQRKSSNVLLHLDQALKRLQDGGRLVALIGKPKEGMRGKQTAVEKWIADIPKRYALRARIGVSGKGYKKYGTSFDNQILVVDKIPSTGQPPPIIGEVQDVIDAIGLLKPVRSARLRPQARPAQPSGLPAVETHGGAPDSGLPTALPARRVGARPRRGDAQSTPEAIVSGVGRHPVELQQPGRSAELSPDQPGRPGTADADTRADSGRTGPAVSEPVNPPSDTPALDRGPDPALLGDNPGVSEQDATAPAQPASPSEAMTDAVYDTYRPPKLRIAGAKPHPGNLVESAAMASTPPPTPTYQPHLPKALVEKGGLSLAQLEAVVYAGQAHAQMLPDGTRRGFYVGDGTGVGKGREISGIILDNFNQGRKKAIWISEKNNLMKSAVRDWSDLGQSEGDVFAQSKAKLDGTLSQPKGILFSTYTTLASGMESTKYGGLKGKEDKKTGKTKSSRLEQIIQWVGPDFDGVLVFDEAHNMANSTPQKTKRGDSTPAASALAAVELQKRLPKARVVYFSATAASRIEALSYADRLGLWGPGTAFPDKNAFIAKIQEGGLAAMEIVARDSKAMGVYLSRSLDYRDVTYGRIEHALTPEQREIYDTVAHAWQIIFQNINLVMEVTGAKKNAHARAAARGRFWGSHQRFFNQILTALQMPSVIEDMRAQIDNGNAIVVQLVNTNQATQDRQLERREQDEEDYEDLDLTPRENLMEFVQQSFPTQQYEEYVDDNGKKATRPVRDSEGNPVHNSDAIAMRDELLTQLGAIKVPDGPLEFILNSFGPEAVAEITGRTQRLVRVKDELGRDKVVKQKRSRAITSAEAKQFQDDQRKILVFSDAGGTGESYHADKRAKNQRKRIHYLVQPGWRADKAVQGLGRTHRTNEASAPHYVLVTTNLKGHRRFISTIARRLDQLGALTKGQRQTGSSGLIDAKDNLENEYASGAVRKLIEDSVRGQESTVPFSLLKEKMGLDRLIDENGTLNVSAVPDVPQFLNRILALEIDEQNAVFDAFYTRMERAVEYAASKGHLDVGMETYRADAVTVASDQVVYTEPGSGAQTHLIKMDAKHAVSFIPAVTMEQHARFDGFYRNKKSGKIWALIKGGTKTRENGAVVNEFKAFGIVDGQYHYIEEQDVREKMTPVSKKIGAEEWEQAIAAHPPFRDESLYLLTGTMLPIWDRLPTQNVRVLRVQTTDGVRHLGRELKAADVPAVLKRLGASQNAEVSQDPQTILTAILDKKQTAVLANQWKLQRRRVADEWRVEVTGASVGSALKELRDAGLVVERIGFETRFFVPTGERGTAVLANVLRHRPVAEMLASKENAGRLAMDVPTLQEGPTPAPTFFSQAIKTIEQKMPARATVQQVRGILSPENGVKPDELKWMGLEAFLTGKETIEKTALLDYMRENQVQIKEVEKRTNSKAGKWVRRSPGQFTYTAAMNVSIVLNDNNSWDVMRDWNKQGKPFASLEDAKTFAEDTFQLKDLLEENQDFDETVYKPYSLHGGKDHRELLLTWKKKPTSMPEVVPLTELPYGWKAIRDPKVQNFYAVKPKDRIEAYAGWHETEEKAVAEALEYLNHERKLKAIDDWKYSNRLDTYNTAHWSEPNILAHVRYNDRIGPEGEKILHLEEVQSDWHQAARNGYRVPDAPFRKTWHEFALKRMLRYAAERGYDALTWTTGAQQADRYDLRKYVSSIGYKKRGDHLWQVTVWGKGESAEGIFNSEHADEDWLESHLGKELAKKIISGEGSKAGEFTYLEDLDLKVGGEGMAGFYDRIMPDFLRKYGKRWGSSVGTATIDVNGTPTAVHALTITEPMRRSVMEGQALFQRLTPSQRILNNTPYEKRDHTDSAKSDALATAAVGDLDHAADSVRSAGGVFRIGSGATVLGLGFTPSLIRTGRVDLRGRIVRSARDLARLAQVWRDPRFETFRIVYTKDNAIVGQEAVTSRLPGATSLWVEREAKTRELERRLGDFAEVTNSGFARLTYGMARRMQRIGANGYFLLHNHPSGRPLPSGEDFHVTERITTKVKGFRGHVVIDSGEYGVIDKNLNDRIVSFPATKQGDRLMRPALAHPAIGANVVNVDDLAQLAKSLQNTERSVSVIYAGASASGKGFTVRAIEDVPLNLMLREDEFRGYLRGRASAYGAVGIFTAYRQIRPAVAKELGQVAVRLVRSGELMDHIQYDTPVRMWDKTEGIEARQDRLARTDGSRVEMPVPAYESVDHNVEERIKAAQSGVGKTGLRAKLREVLDATWRKSTREFEHLPDTAEFSRLRTSLLQLQKQRAISVDRQLRHMHDLVGDLIEEDYNLFERAVILRDLKREADAEHLLPFGYTPETLQRDLERVNAEVSNNMLVEQRLEQRTAHVKDLSQRYVKAMGAIGFDVAHKITREDYFHHQVLEYAREQAASSAVPGTGRKIKTPTGSGFLKRREGSTLDINANYVQAELEVLGKMDYDIHLAEVIATVDEEHNIQPRLKEEARQYNEQAIRQVLAQEGMKGPLNDEWNKIRQKIAMHMSRLKSALNIPASQTLSLDSIQKIAQDSQQVGHDSALGVFKWISRRREFIKTVLGDNFKTWEDLVPDGYTEWQPREGQIFYMADTIPHRLAQQLQERMLAELNVPAEQVKKILALGGKREQYVVPQEVYDTLSTFTPPPSGVIEALSAQVLGTWKAGKLVGPHSVIKYNLRNLTGDLDATFAGNPRALRRAWQAMKELWPVFTKQGTLEGNAKDWYERGGMGTLLQVQEMGDVHDLKIFKALVERRDKGGVMGAVSSVFNKYWETARLSTDFREAILRYANYLEYLDQIKETGKPANYGASIVETVDALKTAQDKAFKLSNELVGAYDRISVTGQHLRKHWIPFWSWKEVNFTRYKQLLKNALKTNNMPGVARATASRAALSATSFAFRATLLWSMTLLWNALFFPDEERDLSERTRNRIHLIIPPGRDEHGKILYLDGIGALGDLLSWIGLDTAASHLAAGDLLHDRVTLGELVKMMAKQPLNILVQGLNPMLKLPAELAAGKQAFPDFFHPRAIQDPMEYTVQQLTPFGTEYKAATGKPGVPYVGKEALEDLFVSRQDPGWAAYSTWQDIEDKWKARLGKSTFEGARRSPKGQALNQWAQAVRLHDAAAVTKYKQRYIDLGGDLKSMKASIKAMAPLHGLNKDERAYIVGQLDSTERGALTKAEAFYQNEIMAILPPMARAEVLGSLLEHGGLSATVIPRQTMPTRKTMAPGMAIP